MINAENQTHWLQQQLSQLATDLPGRSISWFEHTRKRAEQSLSRLPVLNRKQEAWRYTSVEGLMKTRFIAASPDITDLERVDLNEWALPSQDSYRLVFLNGRCVPQLTMLDGISTGVKFGSLRAVLLTDPEMLSVWFGQVASHDTNIFTALNTALVNDGLFLHIDRAVELDRPLEVIYLSTSGDQPVMMQPRNLIVLESAARATLVEHFIGTDEAHYFHNNLTEIVVGEKASLRHYRIQNESHESSHLSSLYLSQDANSHYQGTTLAFGGAWARTDYNTTFRQEGANCELSGLYTVGDNQLTDFHLDVRHSVPACKSREQFKGILYGKGRAVFDGRVLVDRQAQRSDAHLKNDNLMLTRNAEIDTKPQLEIYADDVKCSHGTTVGQIEPEQLFYLRSRGIDSASARKILSLGFAGEIIDNIGLEPLREYAYEKLTTTLNRAMESNGRDYSAG